MTDTATIDGPAPKRLSNAYQNWYRFSRNPTAVIGATIVILCILIAIFAPMITPYPKDVGAVVNFRARHLPPSLAHWFGTDDVGRDVLTRVAFGYRISLLLVLVVLGTAVPFGSILGMLAGYFGGWVEIVIMRLTDIALAIPPLVMALAVAAVLNPSLVNSMLAVAILWWTWHTRLVYSITRQLRTQEFIEAAETLGASKMHIIFREILPNCISAIAVKTSLDAGFVILVGALCCSPHHLERRSSASVSSRRRPTSARWSRAVRRSCRTNGGNRSFPAAPSCSWRSASICLGTASVTFSTCRTCDERRPAVCP